METVSQFLGAFGMLGLVAGVLLGLVVLLVLPWCAIIECVRSERGSNAKAVLVVALIVTWGLGSLVYGIFLTRSRALRIFAVAGVVLPLLILVPSVVSLGAGVGMAADLRDEQVRAERAALTAAFRPEVLAVDAVEPFRALRFVHGRSGPRSAALAGFTLDGPDAGTARDVDERVRHVACDASNTRCFAVTAHDFGTISPSTGRFSRIEVDPALGDFGWPAGLAWDERRREVVVVTSHVYTRFYRYDPATAEWQRLPAEIRDLPVVGLAWSPDDDCLYALDRGAAAELALRSIHRFNASGAVLGSIAIEPPIPIAPDDREFFQLHHASGRLVLVLPPFDPAGGERIFVVDPGSGAVSTARTPPVTAADPAAG